MAETKSTTQKIETSFLRVEKNCLEIEGTCIQLSNVSILSTMDVTPPDTNKLMLYIAMVIGGLGRHGDGEFVSDKGTHMIK